MPERKPTYRVEARFKEVLELTQPHNLVIRQIGDNAFVVCMIHPTTGAEYILSTQRSPEEPRAFVRSGAAVEFAIRLSGIKVFHFELLENSLGDEDAE